MLKRQNALSKNKWRHIRDRLNEQNRQMRLKIAANKRKLRYLKMLGTSPSRVNTSAGRPKRKRRAAPRPRFEVNNNNAKNKNYHPNNNN